MLVLTFALTSVVGKHLKTGELAMEALQDKVVGATVSWKMMVATIAGTDRGMNQVPPGYPGIYNAFHSFKTNKFSLTNSQRSQALPSIWDLTYTTSKGQPLLCLLSRVTQ